MQFGRFQTVGCGERDSMMRGGAGAGDHFHGEHHYHRGGRNGSSSVFASGTESMDDALFGTEKSAAYRSGFGIGYAAAAGLGSDDAAGSYLRLLENEEGEGEGEGEDGGGRPAAGVVASGVPQREIGSKEDIIAENNGRIVGGKENCGISSGNKGGIVKSSSSSQHRFSTQSLSSSSCTVAGGTGGTGIATALPAGGSAGSGVGRHVAAAAAGAGIRGGPGQKRFSAFHFSSCHGDFGGSGSGVSSSSNRSTILDISGGKNTGGIGSIIPHSPSQSQGKNNGSSSAGCEAAISAISASAAGNGVENNNDIINKKALFGSSSQGNETIFKKSNTSNFNKNNASNSAGIIAGGIGVGVVGGIVNGNNSDNADNADNADVSNILLAAQPRIIGI